MTEPEPHPSIQQRVGDWLLSGDTGMSSMAICAHMLGGSKGEFAIPWDTDDFGRCARLLNRIPEWKERMPEMTCHGEGWAAFAPQWDMLMRMHATKDRELQGAIRLIVSRVRGVESMTEPEPEPDMIERVKLAISANIHDADEDSVRYAAYAVIEAFRPTCGLMLAQKAPVAQMKKPDPR